MTEVIAVVATVSKGGRMRIPRAVLDHLGLKDGDQVVFFPRSGKRLAIVTTMDVAVSGAVREWLK